MSVGSEAAAEFRHRQHVPQPFYQQDLANADWAAVSDQFFTTLIAPLTAKGNGVWGRRFDISPEQKTYGLSGALRMPLFSCRRPNLQREVRDWAGQKFIIAWPGSITTKPRSWISECSKSSASFCSLSQLAARLHWLLRLVDSRAHRNY